MNELENLVFRNGRFYDKRTSNRVFVKQSTINDSDVEGTNAPLEGDNATESPTEPLQGIIKPPVKRTGGRPKKQTT
jgi:protein involved in sex pheromone biosynthesis